MTAQPVRCKQLRSYMRCNENLRFYYLACLLGFVALRPKSTAMVVAGRSVHITTLFPGQA